MPPAQLVANDPGLALIADYLGFSAAAQQSLRGLTGPPLALNLPAWRTRWPGLIRVLLEIHDGHVAQPTWRIQALTDESDAIDGKRWVDKHDVERVRRRGRQIAQCIALQHGHVGGFAEQRGIVSEPLNGRPALFDRDQRGGPARYRLEAKCTGTGEEIEATRLAQIVAQPVEERLTDTIRCRPQPVSR